MITSRFDVVDARIDEAPIGAHQIKTLIFCAMFSFVELFDFSAMSFVVPLIAKDWGVAAGTFGVVLSAAVLGLGVGSFIGGPMGDKLGRKPIILIGGLLISVGCFATFMAGEMTSLITARLVTGFGLGLSLPNVYGLSSDYMPKRRKALAVTMVSAAGGVGSIVVGLVAPFLVAVGGWHAIFIVCGLLPWGLIIAAIFFLHESPRLLASMEGRDKALRSVLSKMAIESEGLPDDPANVKKNTAQSPLSIVGRAYIITTILFAIVWISSTFSHYFLVSWLPTILVGAGWTSVGSMHAMTVVFVGALIGAMLISWIMDRLSSPLMAPTLAAATAALALFAIGWLITDRNIYPLLVIVGMTSGGFVYLTPSLATRLYPPRLLGTGLGWVYAVGRTGAIAGPILGGKLILDNWTSLQIFSVYGASFLVCTACLWALIIHQRGAVSLSVDANEGPRAKSQAAAADAAFHSSKPRSLKVPHSLE